MKSVRYEGKIVLSNKNNSHTLAFDRIAEIAAGRKLKILEVGCSSGYFGAALIHHGHEVWGVEPFIPAAQEARKCLTHVHTGNIEEFFTCHPDAKFDVIVFGDVLEHLIDPRGVLVQSASFLSCGGAVIASVPNVAHFAVRAMLLEGRWDYADLGILDRTHLRFYTRDSVIDLFSDAAYRVESIDAVQISAESADALCAMNLKKESIAMARQFAGDHRGTDFQYVIAARPGQTARECHENNKPVKTEAGLRVLCLPMTTESSIVDIRICGPLKRWAQTHAGAVRVVSIYEHSVADLEWADVVVFQREADQYLLGLTDMLQARGKKVVFEIDDYLLELPPFLAHHERSLAQRRPYMIEMMRKADALSVSTPLLGRQLAGFNRNLHITPNCGKPNPNRARHFSCQPHEVTLVVASSDSVRVDMLTDPLRRMQKQYDCRIIGIGPPGQYLAEQGIRVRLQDNMTHTDFCRFLSAQDNTIGIIPLDNSLFSSCKSAVKYFDYSMAGLPSVCSNVSPYSDVIQNGCNGYLVDNATAAWTNALSALIEDSGLRSRISESARLFVADCHNLDLSAKAWSGVFESLDIDLTNTRNSRVDAPVYRRNFRQAIGQILKYAVRPSAYVNALSIFKQNGIKGIYERMSRS